MLQSNVRTARLRLAPNALWWALYRGLRATPATSWSKSRGDIGLRGVAFHVDEGAVQFRLGEQALLNAGGPDSTTDSWARSFSSPRERGLEDEHVVLGEAGVVHQVKQVIGQAVPVEDMGRTVRGPCSVSDEPPGRRFRRNPWNGGRRSGRRTGLRPVRYGFTVP